MSFPPTPVPRPTSFRIAIFLISVFSFLIPLAHAAPTIDVTARVDRATITVGDPVRYEITVTAPAGARVDLPAVRGNTGALEITGYAVRADSAPDGRALVTHALELAAWEVGEDTLPPQRVEVRRPPDTAAVVLYTQPTYITVRPTVAADAGDIAEIHDAERLPRSFPWGLPLLVAFLAAAVLFHRAWKKWRALRPLPAAPPRSVPADEAALARLRALEESDLLAADKGTEGGAEEGGSRAFAFVLSEILREYLAARFGIDALEATTPELLERAAPLPFPAGLHAWLDAVSAELDRVKFAAGVLSPEAGSRLIGEARDFVHATAVDPAAPAVDAARIPDNAETAP